LFTSLRIACVRVPRDGTDGRAPGEGWGELAGALLRVAPRVTPLASVGGGELPLGAWADVSGMAGHGGDAAVAQALLAAARGAGFAEARVGVAGSCVAAALSTRVGGSAWRVVPEGGDARFVSRRALSMLPMDDGVRETLKLLGLKSCADLAALPASEVELRLGSEGVRVWRLARAEDPRWPFRPAPPAEIVAEAELEGAVEAMEPLRFLVRGLLGSVLEQLGRRQRIPAGVRLVLLLDDGTEHALRVRPARATADERVLGDLCWRALEGATLHRPVVALRMEGVEEGRARADQLDIFRPPAPDPAAVHAALLPLLARWGECALSRAAPRGAHLPGEGVVWEAAGERGVLELAAEREDSGFRIRDSGEDPSAAPSLLARLPLRLRRLAPPTPLPLETDAEGRPVALQRAVPRGRAERVALRAEGPERLSGRWWGGGYAREYWLAEGADGQLRLIYQDAKSEEWFLEGWYD
jgi:protein ImuB